MSRYKFPGRNPGFIDISGNFAIALKKTLELDLVLWSLHSRSVP